MTAQRHRIVVEGDDATNYSAYSPDVPGVVATGATREECERELREAIEFHLEGLSPGEQGEAASPVPPLLAFENVSKRYARAGEERVVLNRVSFEIPAGAIVGVLGARRAGKSTLLRLMAGVEAPSAGVVRFEDTDVTALSARKREGLLRGRVVLVSTQQAWPSVNTKVVDEVALPLMGRGLSPSDATRRARRMLERVEIADRADESLSLLSLVDRPRVRLAQALALEPTLLLMDEPAVMPSHSASQRFLALLRAVASERQMTLVMASEEPASLFGVEILMSIDDGELGWVESQATVIDFPKRNVTREDRVEG
jgi:ABC-type methionine transport system ATPase subunit